MVIKMAAFFRGPIGMGMELFETPGLSDIAATAASRQDSQSPP
jgi:hypothetical protein